MFSGVLCLTAALLAFPVAEEQAAPTHTRVIQLKAGDWTSLDTPLTLPWEGPAPKGRLVVVQDKTMKEFPATVHEGRLTFIIEGSLPGAEHKYFLREGGAEEAWTPKVVVKKREGEHALDVLIDDALLTTYWYKDGERKPYLWPMNSEGGVTVTRDFPMDPKDLPKDHPHHRSVWTSYGDINGADCWMEEPKAGWQLTQEVQFGSGDAFGWIRAKNTWTQTDKTPVVDEEREYRFYATPERLRLFDVRVTFTARHGDAHFIDTKEGGIVAVRMRRELCGAKGVITNALGDVGEANTWGKPAAWCDMSGEIPELGWRGLAIFDHPKNLRHPSSWHVRAYGLMGANCFGYSYFGEKDYNKPLLPAERGDYLLKAGESLTFNYRVCVHSGDVEKAAVGDRYKDYATPPEVAWVN
jgi:hypothetical protein